MACRRDFWEEDLGGGGNGGRCAAAAEGGGGGGVPSLAAVEDVSAAPALLARPSLVERAAVMPVPPPEPEVMSGCLGAPNMSPRKALGWRSWGCKHGNLALLSGIHAFC